MQLRFRGGAFRTENLQAGCTGVDETGRGAPSGRGLWVSGGSKVRAQVKVGADGGLGLGVGEAWNQVRLSGESRRGEDKETVSIAEDSGALGGGEGWQGHC